MRLPLIPFWPPPAAFLLAFSLTPRAHGDTEVFINPASYRPAHWVKQLEERQWKWISLRMNKLQT